MSQENVEAMRRSYDAHGADSDTPLEEKIRLLSQWRRGKCLRWRTYETEAEALEAVALGR